MPLPNCLEAPIPKVLVKPCHMMLMVVLTLMLLLLLMCDCHKMQHCTRTSDSHASMDPRPLQATTSMTTTAIASMAVMSRVHRRVPTRASGASIAVTSATTSLRRKSMMASVVCYCSCNHHTGTSSAGCQRGMQCLDRLVGWLVG
jgi:hypothetical protein